MNSAKWKRLGGEVGAKPKEEMRSMMDDGGIYIPYVTQDDQGGCVYTVLGDVKNNVEILQHNEEDFINNLL